LPEVFTKDDIKRCFGKDSPQYVYTKIRRLADDNLIETIEEGEIQKEGGILVLKLAINR
jgi:DNA-binding PadR family transcriptional regulator